MDLDMTKIQIIVGSEMGGTEEVAKYLAKELEAEHAVSVNAQASANDLTRDPEEFLVFCTANTGCGDLPANISPLYAQLKTEFPNIAYRKYALANFGDSSYPTYGEAGNQLNDALLDIGAQLVGEPLLIDAGTNRHPQLEVLAWLREILDTLN
jgi:MioC protein